MMRKIKKKRKQGSCQQRQTQQTLPKLAYQQIQSGADGITNYEKISTKLMTEVRIALMSTCV